jgi:hypothetical protein
MTGCNLEHLGEYTARTAATAALATSIKNDGHVIFDGLIKAELSHTHPE